MEVGDPDSFGRPVRYLGVAQTSSIVLAPDCTGVPPEQGHCVTLTPAGGTTSFDEAGLARIVLPEKATNSLICFALTPVMAYDFSNDTGVLQPSALFIAVANITVENQILDDPALINPLTGEPFGGRLSIGVSTYRESRSLAVDERASKRVSLTRECIGGLVSRRALVEVFGLSEVLAQAFFKKPNDDQLWRVRQRATRQLRLVLLWRASLW